VRKKLTVFFSIISASKTMFEKEIDKIRKVYGTSDVLISVFNLLSANYVNEKLKNEKMNT
jgi:hypothetical protein